MPPTCVRCPRCGLIDVPALIAAPHRTGVGAPCRGPERWIPGSPITLPEVDPL